jgi:hypothetical protein
MIGLCLSLLAVQNGFVYGSFSYFVPGPWRNRVAIASEPTFQNRFVTTFYDLSGKKLGQRATPARFAPAYFRQDGKEVDYPLYYDFAGDHSKSANDELPEFYVSYSGGSRIVEWEERLFVLASNGRLIPIASPPKNTLVASNYSGTQVVSIRFDTPSPIAYVSDGANRWRQVRLQCKSGPAAQPHLCMCLGSDDTAYFIAPITQAQASIAGAQYGFPRTRTKALDFVGVFACDLRSGQTTIVAHIAFDHSARQDDVAINHRRDQLYVTPESNILLTPYDSRILTIPLPLKPRPRK